MGDCQIEETRVLLRAMNREVRREIASYKSCCWQSFLQQSERNRVDQKKRFGHTCLEDISLNACRFQS